MYRIIDDRATGKTSRLMLIAKENNAKFACGNPSAMRQKAYAYGITGIDFISYNDLFNGSLFPCDKVVIDEMEECMKEISQGNLVGYSLSKDD